SALSVAMSAIIPPSTRTQAEEPPIGTQSSPAAQRGLHATTHTPRVQVSLAAQAGAHGVDGVEDSPHATARRTTDSARRRGIVTGPIIARRGAFGKCALSPRGVIPCAPMVPGDEIAGRFVVDEVANTGSYSTLYRAHDRSTAESVALKVMGGLDGSDLTR